jgi:uncharacterized surface protein with fasciclin (FAS1) repeats
MKRMNKIFIFTILFLTGTFAGFAQDDYFSGVEDTEDYSALELALMDDRFSNFVEFLELSGLDLSVEFAEDFTILMPTNEAFAEMEVERLAYLSDPENRLELIQLIKNHMLPTKVMKYEFNETQVANSAGDEEILIGETGDIIYVGGAKILASDIEAEDAVIHVVDGVVEATKDVTMD